MSQNVNSINKEIKISKNEESLSKNNKISNNNIYNNITYQNKSIKNKNNFFFNDNSSSNNSISLKEENILIKILEEKKNEDSFSQISKIFKQKDFNYSKIHDNVLYNTKENNFIYNIIIKNNSNRIKNISNKINSMKSPYEISTKDTNGSFLNNNNNKKEKNSRNDNKKEFDEVKFSCCCLNNKIKL